MHGCSQEVVGGSNPPMDTMNILVEIIYLLPTSSFLKKITKSQAKLHYFNIFV